MTAATPQEKAAKSARTRNMAAAKRSLKLIADVVAQHAGLLKQGAVPEASFMVYALKYEQARSVLVLLDTISTADGAADGLIEVRRDDLEVMIAALRAVVPASMLGEDDPDTPLVRLDAAVVQGVSPATAPDGEPDPGSPPMSSEEM